MTTTDLRATGETNTLYDPPSKARDLTCNIPVSLYEVLRAQGFRKGGRLVTNHTKPPAEKHGTMKALIIYDKVECAKRAMKILRRVSSSSGMRSAWEFKPWRADVLSLSAAADEALREGVDADVIVFAELAEADRRASLMDWLHRWGIRRRSQEAALVLTNVRTNTRPPGPRGPNQRLVSFVAQHGLDLIVEESPSIDPIMPITIDRP